MSVQVIMDGVSYRLNVRYETLGRSFRLEEGQNAGTMLSGDYTRDLMGTYYDYSMEVEPDPRFPADYDAFTRQSQPQSPATALPCRMGRAPSPLTQWFPKVQISIGGKWPTAHVGEACRYSSRPKSRRGRLHESDYLQ